MESIWIEKYRPLSLSDCAGNESALERLRAIESEGAMGHILVTGPPGIGKTSSLHCLARSLLGKHYPRAVLELNAADERGIDVVREKVKNFAREVVDLPDGRTKIVILDEVDSMTDAAQQALRRLMEVYSNTTRFALACNQSDKVLDPIQSRCAIIRFTRISADHMKRQLTKICDAEALPYSDEALNVVIAAAEGDLRKSIGSIQAAAAAYGKVSIPEVYHACDIPPAQTLQEVLNHCQKGVWRPGHEALMQLVEDGYSVPDLLKALKNVVENSNWTENRKVQSHKEIVYAMMSTHRHKLNRLQLDQLLCRLCEISLHAR